MFLLIGVTFDGIYYVILALRGIKIYKCKKCNKQTDERN
jgi:hypothetical protein